MKERFLRLFIMLRCVSLHSVIVAFLDHTHLLFATCRLAQLQSYILFGQNMYHLPNILLFHFIKPQAATFHDKQLLNKPPVLDVYLSDAQVKYTCFGCRYL